MKKITFLSLLFFGMFLTVKAQSPEEMKTWEAYMTPGEPHQLLKDMSGTWSAQIKMWMDPSQEPVKSQGTVNYSMILGDRYQEGVFKSMMMGMPFEGRQIMGYDNATEMYVSVWMDNMGTGIMKTQGIMNKDGILVMEGMMVDPIQGKEIPVLSKGQIEGKRQFFEMFVIDENKNLVKTMEINYTKKD